MLVFKLSETTPGNYSDFDMYIWKICLISENIQNFILKKTDTKKLILFIHKKLQENKSFATIV
ncbi:MAG: hypothetical protein A2Y12_19785 [Planctomycetes bacterium GWF2_42_9]|nr:MAG: hypothetical protein A2Y12_19785 [Planctomycetes bacterium GWF2_42_9]